MEKVDFKKDDTYRARAGQFRVLDLPPAHYLMVDGHGDPNTSSDFGGAIEALYPVAYALKFASKVDLGRDYVVPPLEGLWWAEDMDHFTVARDKSRWDWTLMLRVPDWLGEEQVAAAVERTRAKRAPDRLDDVRLEELHEGRCVQTLHVGSFEDEGPVLATMHDVHITDAGLVPSGKHHEIYFSDVRKVSPERQRTILRQPVAEA